MRAVYRRHIFTWSEESILSRSPGWGIAASSTPYDKQGLRELEKMASAGKADYSGGIPAEMLLYSASCGYVKMRVTPRQSGNAGRRNKYVQMYQLTGDAESPAAYLEPGQDWGAPEEDGMLAPLEMELPGWSRIDFLDSLNLREYIRDLVPYVYKTVTGEISQLNLAAPGWADEDFAGNAKKVMFLIHDMIPSILRRQAGYLSFSRIPVKGVSFVFSPRPLKKPCFILGEAQPEAEGEERSENETDDRGSVIKDTLEEDFFSWITDRYLEEDGELTRFFLEADRLLGNLKDHAGTLKKLEYLWLGQYKDLDGPEDTEMLLKIMPEVLYYGEVEPELRQTSRRIRDRIHAGVFSETDRINYIKRLMGGCTMKSLGSVAEETLWALSAGFDWDRRRETLMQDIKERNRILYQKITGEYEPANPDWAEDDGIPVIVPELEEKQEEEIGIRETGEAEEAFAPESAASLPPAAAAGGIDDASDASLAETADRDISKETGDDSISFLLTGIVQGFMTGCMIYLAHYTIRLGHWKIALGLFGVWILLNSNYWYILRQKGEQRPLWKIWGLCLSEGILIDMVAWFFPDQRIRLYFFIILGIIVFLMQMTGILKLAGGQETDSQKEG